MKRVVIVGAGQGGFQAAVSLRQEGFSGAITLIGDEPGLPYQRPPLSKAFLKNGDAGRIVCRPASFFERNNIEVLPSTRVEGLDRATGRVHLTGGTQRAYDHLILATGARNAIPPIDGVSSTNVFGLRTHADAAALREALRHSTSAVVIGGGFIGLEFAAVCAAMSLPVTVVEAAPRLMARAVSPIMSELFSAHHARLGTHVLVSQTVRTVIQDANGVARGVQCVDGTHISADLVLLATGIRPNVELAQAAGLDTSNGILIDRSLRTSDPNISALGDCAAFAEPRTKRHIRLESVQAATDHARFIARRIVTDEAAQYDAVPWFWSDQADWKLQIAGLGDAADEEYAIAESMAPPAVFRFAHDRLVSLETVNAPGLHLAGRTLLTNGAAITHNTLKAASYDVRRLAQDAKHQAQGSHP